MFKGNGIGLNEQEKKGLCEMCFKESLREDTDKRLDYSHKISDKNGLHVMIMNYNDVDPRYTNGCFES